MKRNLFIDYDGVIVNSIKTIVTLYNEDFKYYKNFTKIEWSDINTWNFEECNCASKEYINTYFNQMRFFNTLEYMDWAKEILDKLNKKYNITIISSGYSPNLIIKNKWIKEHLSYCKFIGVNFKKYKDKSHINMYDGIFIDDSCNNLITSNAKIKICFGDIYPWNEKWEGIRCANWTDINNFLMKRGDELN